MSGYYTAAKVALGKIVAIVSSPDFKTRCTAGGGGGAASLSELLKHTQELDTSLVSFNNRYDVLTALLVVFVIVICALILTCVINGPPRDPAEKNN